MLVGELKFHSRSRCIVNLLWLEAHCLFWIWKLLKYMNSLCNCYMVTERRITRLTHDWIEILTATLQTVWWRVAQTVQTSILNGLIKSGTDSSNQHFEWSDKERHRQFKPAFWMVWWRAVQRVWNTAIKISIQLFVVPVSFSTRMFHHASWNVIQQQFSNTRRLKTVVKVDKLASKPFSIVSATQRYLAW